MSGINKVFDGIVRNGSDHLLFSPSGHPYQSIFVYNRSGQRCAHGRVYVCVRMHCHILGDIDGNICCPTISLLSIVQLFALEISKVN